MRDPVPLKVTIRSNGEVWECTLAEGGLIAPGVPLAASSAIWVKISAGQPSGSITSNKRRYTYKVHRAESS